MFIRKMAKYFITFFLLTLSFRESITAVFSPKDLDPKICQEIWTAAGNNLKVPLELRVDLTGGTNQVFTPEPAGNTKLASEVFSTFKDLLQNNIQTNQLKFIDVITKPGGPVDKAREYLNANGILKPPQDKKAFEKTLWTLWFDQPGKGFQHVFIGEKLIVKNKNVYSGFHNWYQFYLQQLKGPTTIKDVNIKPNSYTYNTEPSFMSLNFVWDGHKKKFESSMFVGTSPAFDFAIFSLCYIVLFNTGAPETDCSCKIHKTTVTVRAIELNNKKFPKTGKICTAFPPSVVPDPFCTTTYIPPTSRTDCGWLGIDHHNCAERGCCFDSQQHGGHIYWCFYPSDHKCHGILPQKRKDCGFPGISRNECEGKGCCFDENFGHGVPHCFVGVPKG